MNLKIVRRELNSDFRTKKQAKQAAAENALKSIVQFRNPLEAQVLFISINCKQGL